MSDQEIQIGPPRREQQIVGLDCGHDCGHSEAEHTAFDQGLRDGELGQDENPYNSPLLRFAWDSGHSVGVMNRDDQPNLQLCRPPINHD